MPKRQKRVTKTKRKSSVKTQPITAKMFGENWSLGVLITFIVLILGVLVYWRQEMIETENRTREILARLQSQMNELEKKYPGISVSESIPVVPTTFPPATPTPSGNK